MALPTESVLRVGERGSWPLASAGSVGYFWHLEIDGDRDAVSVRTGPIDQPPALEAPQQPWGGSAQQALFVEALAPGEVRLGLRLMRRGSALALPREAHQLVITVVP